MTGPVIITVDDRWGLRGGTKANLATVNPIPLAREAMIETDTGRIKVGNGVDHWLDLQYINLGFIDFTDLAHGFTPVWDAGSSTFKMVANSSASGAGTDLKTTARLYDEGYLPAATMGWSVDASGTGAVLAQQSVAGMNGAYGLASGGTATNRGGMVHGGFFCEVGSGEIRSHFRLQPQHTPGGAQQSQYAFGIKSGIGTTGIADYIHVQADDTTGGWLLKWVCQAAGTNGASVLPGAITAGATKAMEILVEGGGAYAAFSIGGVVIDTLSLPSGFVPMRPYVLSRKNGANGGSSTLWVDKVLVEQDR